MPMALSIFPLLKLHRNQREFIIVMLSKAKHLVFQNSYEDEIPRLRLGMTLAPEERVERMNGTRVFHLMNKE